MLPTRLSYQGVILFVACPTPPLSKSVGAISASFPPSQCSPAFAGVYTVVNGHVIPCSLWYVIPSRAGAHQRKWYSNLQWTDGVYVTSRS